MIVPHSVSADHLFRSLNQLPASAAPAPPQPFEFMSLLHDAPPIYAGNGAGTSAASPATPPGFLDEHPDHEGFNADAPAVPAAPEPRASEASPAAAAPPVPAVADRDKSKSPAKKSKSADETSDQPTAETAAAAAGAVPAETAATEPVVDESAEQNSGSADAVPGDDLEVARQQAVAELVRLLTSKPERGQAAKATAKNGAAAAAAAAPAPAKVDQDGAETAKIAGLAADSAGHNQAVGKDRSADIAAKARRLGELLEKALPDATQRRQVVQVLEQAVRQAGHSTKSERRGEAIAALLEKASGVKIQALHVNGQRNRTPEQRLENALEKLLASASTAKQQAQRAVATRADTDFSLRLRRLLGQHRPAQPELSGGERKPGEPGMAKPAMAAAAAKLSTPAAKGQAGGQNTRGDGDPGSQSGREGFEAALATANSAARPAAALAPGSAAASSFTSGAAREVFEQFQQMLGRGPVEAGSRLALRFESSSFGNVNMAVQDQNGTLTLALQGADEAARQRLLGCRDELISQLRAMGYSQVNVQVSGGSSEQQQDQASRQKHGNDVAENVRLAGRDELSSVEQALEELLQLV